MDEDGLGLRAAVEQHALADGAATAAMAAKNATNTPINSLDIAAVLSAPLPDVVLRAAADVTTASTSSASSPHSSSPPYHMQSSPPPAGALVDPAAAHPALTLGPPYPAIDPATFDAARTTPVVLPSAAADDAPEVGFDALFGNVMAALDMAPPHAHDDDAHAFLAGPPVAEAVAVGMEVDMDMPMDMDDVDAVDPDVDDEPPPALQAQHMEQAMRARREACLHQQGVIERKLGQLMGLLRQQQARVTEYQLQQHLPAGTPCRSALEAERHTMVARTVPEARTNLTNARLYRRRLDRLQRDTDPDATDSSSALSEDDDDELTAAAGVPAKLLRKRRKVQSRWDRARADVGWRWSWLRERVADLETDIRAHRLASRELRRQRTPLHDDGLPQQPDSCARAAVTVAPGKRRKLCHPTRASTVRSPLPLSRSAAAAAGVVPIPASDPHAIQVKSAAVQRSFHPVLSFPGDAPHAVLAAARRQRRTLHQHHETERTQRRQRDLSTIHSPSSPFVPTRAASTGSLPSAATRVPAPLDLRLESPLDTLCVAAPATAPGSARRHRLSSAPSTPRSPWGSSTDLMGSLSASGSSGGPRRRRATVDLAIDDVMLPAQLAPSHVTPLACKEILTPSWSQAPDLAPFRAEDLPVEDTADQRYGQLHQPFESKEIASFVSAVGGNKRRRSSAADSPSDAAAPGEPPAKRVRGEVRASATSSEAGYAPRTFPLVGADLAALDAQACTPEVVPVYKVITQMDPLTAAAEEEELDDLEEKPIKLVFKLTATRPPAPDDDDD